MRRAFHWLLDLKHPLRIALVCLVIGLANGYEAVYIRPNNLMSIVDGAFALACLMGFAALLLSALSGFFHKADD